MKNNLEVRISNYLEIKKIRDLIKILLGYFVIVFLSLFPIIIAIVGGYFEELYKGHEVNEGNSSIITFGWLALLTIPAGFGFSIVWTIYSVKSISIFIKKIRSNKSKDF